MYIRALVSYACGLEQCNFEGCLKEEEEEKKSQDKGDLDSKQGIWDVSMARDYIIRQSRNAQLRVRATLRRIVCTSKRGFVAVVDSRCF